jgi:hypothetical protein
MSDPTSHPGAFLTLEDGHRLGKAGLDKIFTLGSLWHYGPVYENMEPIYRVVGKQAHHSGGGASILRDHNLAVWEDERPDRHGNRNRSHKSNGWGGPRRIKVKEAPATWFIEVERVSSPWAGRTGLPPCAMIPRALVQWERRTFNIKPGEAPTEPALELIRAEAQKRRTALISEGGWVDAGGFAPCPRGCGSCLDLCRCPMPGSPMPGSRSETIIAGLERALAHADARNRELEDHLREAINDRSKALSKAARAERKLEEARKAARSLLA